MMRRILLPSFLRVCAGRMGCEGKCVRETRREGCGEARMGVEDGGWMTMDGLLKGRKEVPRDVWRGEE